MAAAASIAGPLVALLGATGPLTPQSPAARSIADLWWLMFWLGLAVFIVFLAALAVALRRRAGVAEDLDDVPDVRTATPERFATRWLTIAGVVVPLLILIWVYGATLFSMRTVSAGPPDDVMTIEVTGHQWWWEIHYPDAGVTVANELHLPVGRPVSVQLTSVDVIHSFWVPALGGKMDVLPDTVNTLVLEAEEPGRHRTQCAEFCGLHHSLMRLVVVAESDRDLEAWLSAQAEGDADTGTPAPPVVTPSPRPAP